MTAAERDRPDVAAARDSWRESQPTLDPARLVFVDETSVNTKMHRRYARSPRGERAPAGCRTALEDADGGERADLGRAGRHGGRGRAG